MSSKSKAKEKAADEVVEPKDETNAGDETVNEADNEPEPDTVGEEPSDTAEPAPLLPSVSDLHTRVAKAVHALGTTGHADAVHALHKVEMLTGTLKYALPAAIATVPDEALKADLQLLADLL